MIEARDNSPQSDQKGQPKSKDFENLRKAYELTCARHGAIDDFRGKLLALLPIASGAAGLLLLTKSGEIRGYATVIGLYGCAVTAGLFVYELRGVHECGDVMRQAGKLEEELKVPFDMGQFRDEGPRPGGGLVGAEMASWIVYFSVFGGWLYLALWGLAENETWHIPLILILIVGLILFAAGLIALVLKAMSIRKDEKVRRATLAKREQTELKGQAEQAHVDQLEFERDQLVGP